MKTVNDLLNEFGGTRPAARRLELPVSTVNNWLSNGFPAKHALYVQSVLKDDGKAVSLETLLKLSV